MFKGAAHWAFSVLLSCCGIRPQETISYSIDWQDHTGIYMSVLQGCLTAQAETSLSATREDCIGSLSLKTLPCSNCFEIGSSTEPGAHRLPRPAGHGASGSSCLHFPSTRLQTHATMLVSSSGQQGLSKLPISEAPTMSVFKGVFHL